LTHVEKVDLAAASLSAKLLLHGIYKHCIRDIGEDGRFVSHATFNSHMQQLQEHVNETLQEQSEIYKQKSEVFRQKHANVLSDLRKYKDIAKSALIDLRRHQDTCNKIANFFNLI